MTLIILTIISVTMLLPPVGCIMLWNRYNYFHDGLVHACLFSGVISYFLDISQIPSMLIVACVFAILVFILRFYSNKNAVVSLVSSLFLATTIILASKLNERALFDAMLFGDIFTIDLYGFVVVFGMMCVTYFFLFKYFDQIVLMCIDVALAKNFNIKVVRLEFVILLAMAMVIAVSIKFIGAFLIGTLLIIPSLGARVISKSPIQMIVFSAIIGGISGICGFVLSLIYDLPLSPSISLVSIIMYVILNVITRLKRY